MDCEKKIVYSQNKNPIFTIKLICGNILSRFFRLIQILRSQSRS